MYRGRYNSANNNLKKINADMRQIREQQFDDKHKDSVAAPRRLHRQDGDDAVNRPKPEDKRPVSRPKETYMDDFDADLARIQPASKVVTKPPKVTQSQDPVRTSTLERQLDIDSDELPALPAALMNSAQANRPAAVQVAKAPVVASAAVDQPRQTLVNTNADIVIPESGNVRPEAPKASVKPQKSRHFSDKIVMPKVSSALQFTSQKTALPVKKQVSMLGFKPKPSTQHIVID